MAFASDEVADANDASDDVAVPLFRHESFLEDVEPYVLLFNDPSSVTDPSFPDEIISVA